MSAKFALIVAVFAAIALTSYVPAEAFLFRNYAANNTNKSHHLIVGSRLPNDKLTYQENIVKSSSLWQITEVQKSFSVPVGHKITQVLAWDQKTDGTGAYAKLLKGGPGLRNVTIKFTSQRNHGIHFQVQLYSRTNW